MDIIIDSAARVTSSGDELDASELLALMDQWDVAHAVIAPPDEYLAVRNEEGNREIRALVDEHPARFSGLAVANPWYGEKAEEMLRSEFDRGAKGLYLHPGRQGFHLTESVLNGIIEVCIENERPVYTYTGTPVCAMPFQLAELARRFPSCEFVMGHFAWSDFSGYDAIPAALQASNILIETSCTTYGMVKMAIEKLGEDRVLFGSGYPRSLHAHEFEKIKPLELSDEARMKFMGGNAKRLWNLEL